MKRFLFPALTALIVVVLIVLGTELIATVLLVVTEGHYVPARTRFASKTNTFVQELVGDRRNCGYADTLYPHPYVGFVHHGNPPCGIPDINNVGLFGRDFPSERPRDAFVVLLTGGSVASQFAQGVEGGPSYLERFLNERYVSPTGQPFHVLNGADGAWKQPQQAILFLMYADAVHAVVTLDGFNEHFQLVSSRRFEYPANNFHLVNPMASQNYGDMVARWITGRLRTRAADNAILSRSQAAYGLIVAAESFVERQASSRPAPRTSVDTIFARPSDWSPDHHKAWAIGQYRKYVRAMSGLARDNGTLDAYFIQPAPAVGKPLTPDEKRVVGDLSYAPVYREMTDALVSLRGHNVPVVSLLDVFERDTRTLYGDPIHLTRDANGVSAGYESIAERMATDVAALWKLQRR